MLPLSTRLLYGVRIYVDRCSVVVSKTVRLCASELC
ncbi:hypothetical protein SAMN05216573_13113 [Bradyrhizobium sp. Rc3b]|nr:hypothetical protein SAMN05216573_13113 [Bradyrhizobium sp. Rc3b]